MQLPVFFEANCVPVVRSLTSFAGGNVKYREIVKLIEHDGWFWKRSNGSHNIYKHPKKAGIVVVAYHGAKELPEGTVKSILKQAGLDR